MDLAWIKSLWGDRPIQVTPEEAESLTRRIDRFMVATGYWTGSERSERRRTPRYRPRRPRVCLCWPKDGEFQLVDGAMLDVGQGGVRLEAADAPAVGEYVWLRDASVLPPEGRKARVMEARWSVTKLSYTIRLAFEEELAIDPATVLAPVDAADVRTPAQQAVEVPAA